MVRYRASDLFQKNLTIHDAGIILQSKVCFTQKYTQTRKENSDDCERGFFKLTENTEYRNMAHLLKKPGRFAPLFVAPY